MTTHIDHVVRWWLKDPGDPVAPVRFRDTVGRLDSMPGVIRLSIGTAMAVDWAGPEQSWDVGFVITFDSAEAVAAYRADPLHQAVVDLAGEVADRLEVSYLEAFPLDAEGGAR